MAKLYKKGLKSVKKKWIIVMVKKYVMIPCYALNSVTKAMQKTWIIFCKSNAKVKKH